MACVTPHWPNRYDNSPAMSLLVEVSINGHHFSSGGRWYDFQYYPAARFIAYDGVHTRIESIAPLGGPFAGGTVITVSGQGWTRLGDVRCRMGTLNTESNASIVSAEKLVCRSPRHWKSEVSGTARATGELLEVTLNGQQFHRLRERASLDLLCH